MTFNLLQWFSPSPLERERRETIDLLRRVSLAQAESPFQSSEDISHFIVDVISEAFDEHGTMPGIPLGEAMYAVIKELLWKDAFLFECPTEEDVLSLSVDEAVRLRTTLRQHEYILIGHGRLLPIWRKKLVQLFKHILAYFPDSAFKDIPEGGKLDDDDSVVFPAARAFDLCENLPELIERMLITFFEDDVVQAGLFESLRNTAEYNLSIASGVDPERTTKASRFTYPTDSRLKQPSALVDAYLASTPLQAFLYARLPFAIPFPARFEHTHILGGTGHGKTQLMQFLIYHDMYRAWMDNRSIVVIDSQGDLINTIAHHGYFGSPRFAEKFVLVDPNDVEHPVCLNMFDFNRDRLSGYAPVDREKILNATIELYEYFFGALLGAELTQRQGLIFRYLARLLMEIPDATIHTLRDLMEDGEKFLPYMEKLSGSARHFFATQFFEPKFKETKKQILTRLWGVLSNSSLERMFSHSRNRIDIFELLNEGKIILINTAKDLLGQEGAAIFGRFFISLITQAAIQRAAQPAHTRKPAFVYIDEAQDYFDDNISNLLNQARKFRVGLVFAHQNLDQLGAGLRSSVLASTSIKFAGGVSAKDASALDSEFRTDSDFLLGQRKGKRYTEFACYVKNYTAKGMSVAIPLGFVEAMNRVGDREYEYLLDKNRELYSEPPLLTADIPFPQRALPTSKRATAKASQIEPTASDSAVEISLPIQRAEASLHSQSSPVREVVEHKAPHAEVVEKPKEKKTLRTPKEDVQPGRGGRQHKYLQQLIKQLGEERGFRATIEETILHGAGRVDVSLMRDNVRVAFQVSVTTTKDWELGGIEKCIAAGYTEVALVGSTERHIKGLSKFVEENLDPKDQGRVRYLTSDGIIGFLDSLGMSVSTEQVVRGYKVRTVRQMTDSEDAAARRKAISEVIAKSLQKSTKE